MLRVNKKWASIATVVSMVVVMLISGCATSPKIQAVQVGDNSLSKEQLTAEINRLNATQQQIDANKGVTGTNVASFLFWLPGLAYTYYDASEATRLVEQRRNHLTALYNQKNQSGKRT